MVSWTLVKRFRVRRVLPMTVTVVELMDASSSDDTLAHDEVRDRGAGGARAAGTWCMMGAGWWWSGAARASLRGTTWGVFMVDV
jgi:hypothetical protein